MPDVVLTRGAEVPHAGTRATRSNLAVLTRAAAASSARAWAAKIRGQKAAAISFLISIKCGLVINTTFYQNTKDSIQFYRDFNNARLEVAEALASVASAPPKALDDR